jgi:hypothetical protein
MCVAAGLEQPIAASQCEREDSIEEELLSQYEKAKWIRACQEAPKTTSASGALHSYRVAS